MTPTSLYEKYRPASFGEVLAQDKVVSQIMRLRERSGTLGGRGYFFSGQSGTGKTSICRLIALDIADYPMGIIEVDAQQLDLPMLNSWYKASWTYAMSAGKTGRAYIVNEAHQLRDVIIARLLTILENLPPHTLYCFTTTREGQDKLFECQIDASPLLSRCIKLSLARRGLAEPFARKLVEVATAENLDGKGYPAALELIRQCGNNLREAYEELEKGALIAP